jgi:hypothetical protein
MSVAVLMFLMALAVVGSWLRGNDPRFTAYFTLVVLVLMVLVVMLFHGGEILEAIGP